MSVSASAALPPSHRPAVAFDLLCRVVDNFGDIGVSWRLARQLAALEPLSNLEPTAVRLWVDDWATLRQLLPQAPATPTAFQVGRCQLCPWSDAAPARLAGAVVEMFGCGVPEAWLQAMAEHQPATRWLNVDYLSAEDWVEGCHGLASRHPRWGIEQIHVSPGFSPRTGGLLGPESLAQPHPAAMQSQLAALGAPPAAALQISLFAYEQPALAELWPEWQASPQALWLWVPEGRVLHSLQPLLGRTLQAGDQIEQGALTLTVLPFLPSATYDHLLAQCHFNAVRGEDSCVRAQWAGRPLWWHIYRQDENWHETKLAAWLARYRLQQDSTALKVWEESLWAWNRGHWRPGLWAELLHALPELQAHAQRWQRELQQLPDLALSLHALATA